MNNDFDYYVINSDNPGNVPLMVNDDEFDSFGIGVLSQYRVMDSDFIGHIAFNPTIKIAKPRLIDAMSLRGTCCVFSKKIYDVLNEHNIKHLQLVPAIIRGYKDETFDGYWIANILQKVAFFDEEETEFGYIGASTGTWGSIEKIVLDREKLAAVPLEERLVFVSKENCAFILYHKSVVDIIMSANPEGIVFTPVEEWEG
ncbi:MAG: hypothetical protein LBV38_07225 [Alistipes sp.]|jgi:hypothetical protein|nr:hypothetical protein [Alistipes sp.]